MKSIILYSILASILLLANCPVAYGEYFYCQSGQIPLEKCDSIVTLRLVSGTPGTHYEQFAYEMDCLDDEFQPQLFCRDFRTYRIEPGWSVDAAIADLRNEPIVELAFPAYISQYNTIGKLSDLFIISFNEEVSQTTIDSIYSYYDVIEIEGPLEGTGTRRVIITSESPGNTLDIANLFYESGLVKYSQPAMSAPVLHSYNPDDPLFEYQYFLQNGVHPDIDIDINRAWEITQGDPQTVIAIIDDGLIRTHEDLDSLNVLWSWGRDYVGEYYGTPVEDIDPSPGEYQAHGVACQGIINAKLNNATGVSGIAPNCKIIPIKIFDDERGWGSSDPTIPERAIDRAMQYFRFFKYVPMVISCSWGYEPPFSYDNIGLKIYEAYDMGIPIVFSTGNFGTSYPIGQSICFPASMDITIGAGAVEDDGEHWLWSSSGSGISAVAPSGYPSFIYGDVYTTDQVGMKGYNPAYETCDNTTQDYLCHFGGTSAAAPQVAGILALVRSRRPDIDSYEELKKIIDSSSIDGIGDQYDLPGWDDSYGNGLASAYRALLSISRGDVNNDGTIDVLDIMYLIDYKFKDPPGPEPIPEKSMGDVNCDGVVNVQDIIFLINHKFKGGPAPGVCFNYDMLD